MPDEPSAAAAPAPVTSPAAGPIRQAWHLLGAITVALLRCWPILLVPALLALIAAGTEQGRDAISATASLTALAGPGFHAYAAQGLTTTLATLAALILLVPQSHTSPASRYASHLAAGLVGLLAGYLPLMAFEWYGLSDGEAGFWMASSRLVPPLFVLLVRDLLPRTTPDGPGVGEAGLPIMMVGLAVGAAFVISDSAFVVFGVAAASLALADIWLSRSFDHARLWVQRGVLVLMALSALGGGVVTALDPASWGLRMGSYATLIVALNAWLAFGILLWRCAPRARVLGAVGTVALAYFFLTGPFGVGDVRFHGTRAGGTESLEAHARGWLAERRAEIEQAPGGYPVFLVTADGGGIRAAWWSATLLGLIEDEAPGFVRQTLAMSGVSGGSLGVATFAAQVAQSAGGAARGADRACAGRAWSQCAETVLGTDLLAPALASMLTVDAPRTILRTRLLPDRAAAHEGGFEAAWQRVAGTGLFGEPFTALWSGAHRHAVPLLLLNVTEATTGRRLVMAPVSLGAANAERGDLAPLLDGRELRLSTAVLLSARFPGVSPAGWLPAAGAEGGYALVDGGFADNSGARSASEALAALLRAARAEDLAERIRPIAIMIANDPVPATPPPEVPGPSAWAEVSTFGSLLAPVATLDRLRQANTQRAKREFATAVCAAGGVVLDDFDLREGQVTFPLGWMLAGGTREAMAAQRARMLAAPTSDLSRAIQFSRQATGGGITGTATGCPVTAASQVGAVPSGSAGRQ